MPQTAYSSLLLILANGIISYTGFKNPLFFENYAFNVEKILLYKDYKRLLTAGFLHTGWLHLILNMFTLYFFSGSVETYLGSLLFLVVYFASLVGGNLLALYIHRNHSDYQMVGASGAVCGVIFAAIALFPGMEISLFLFPVYIPAWLYGLVFVLYSIYDIGTKKDNTGHEAHLGSALVGVVTAILIQPSVLIENYGVILTITLPCLIFLYLMVTRPHLLLLNPLLISKKKPDLSIDQRYNANKANQQQEIDAILEKIHRKGINSLNKSEKEKLEIYSRAGK